MQLMHTVKQTHSQLQKTTNTLHNINVTTTSSTFGVLLTLRHFQNTQSTLNSMNVRVFFKCKWCSRKT